MHIATANNEIINAAIITIAKAESTKINGANKIRRNNGIFSFKNGDDNGIRTRVRGFANRYLAARSYRLC